MSLSQLPPRYDRSPSDVRGVSWNGRRSNTFTESLVTICLPPRIFSIVVLPAPLGPIRRTRLPWDICTLMSSTTGGTPGIGRPSAIDTNGYTSYWFCHTDKVEDHFRATCAVIVRQKTYKATSKFKARVSKFSDRYHPPGTPWDHQPGTLD